MWKKIPRLRLHRVLRQFRVCESFVDEPHKFTVLAVKFELAWSSFVVEHDLRVDVISARFRNSQNGPAFVETRVVDDVLGVDVVVVVVDAVEHHLVEEHLRGNSFSVDDFFWEEIRAGDRQRASENEMFVQNY